MKCAGLCVGCRRRERGERAYVYVTVQQSSLVLEGASPISFSLQDLLGM